MPAAKPLRWYDPIRDRLVCTSPTYLTVWKGRKPVEQIAGPWKLTPPPQNETELREAYAEWIEQGEPR